MLILIIVLVASAIGGIYWYANDKLSKMQQVEIKEEDLNINDQVEENLTGYRNIAIFGVDSRSSSLGKGNRSDCIIIASINNETKEVKLASVYRDTYLKIGDTSTYDKITHACMYGGPEMTIKTLNQSLDLDISNYVVVNFKAVADLVDAVGGIEVDVQDYEISELNKYTKYTANNIGREEYQLVESAGVQTLDGCQAVSYSRIRKGVGDDFQRTERMRTVVSATMDKMKGMSFRELKKLVKVVTPQVQTNLSRGDVLGLGIRLPQYNINGTEGWPYNVSTGLLYGVSYVFPSDLYDNVVKLHQEFFGQADYVPSDDVLTMSNTIISNIAEGKKPGKVESDDDKDPKDEDIKDEEFSDLPEDFVDDQIETDLEDEDVITDEQEPVVDGEGPVVDGEEPIVDGAPADGDDAPVDDGHQGDTRFPKLCAIDQEYKEYKIVDYGNSFTLSEMCEYFRNFCASELKLYYHIFYSLRSNL